MAHDTQSTCRYHCVPCGEHFKSLSAFDAHRQGAPEDRFCAWPGEVKGMYLQRKGSCDLTKPGFRVVDVNLWAYVAPKKGDPDV